jgi:hypothetical protein
MVHLSAGQAVLEPSFACLEGRCSMTDHCERLNAWHLELAILADAIDHVLCGIEEPAGVSATAHVLRNNLLDMVENCPFPASPGLPAQPPGAGLLCEKQLCRGVDDAQAH